MNTVFFYKKEGERTYMSPGGARQSTPISTRDRSVVDARIHCFLLYLYVEVIAAVKKDENTTAERFVNKTKQLKSFVLITWNDCVSIYFLRRGGPE